MLEKVKVTRDKTKIQIDKHVPIPVARYITKYPWDDMEIGDSFLLKNYGEKAHALVGAANRKRKPKKFLTRRVATDKFHADRYHGDYRVWRVA